jgi:hypothetical protein
MLPGRRNQHSHAQLNSTLTSGTRGTILSFAISERFQKAFRRVDKLMSAELTTLILKFKVAERSIMPSKNPKTLSTSLKPLSTRRYSSASSFHALHHFRPTRPFRHARSEPNLPWTPLTPWRRIMQHLYFCPTCLLSDIHWPFSFDLIPTRNSRMEFLPRKSATITRIEPLILRLFRKHTPSSKCAFSIALLAICVIC